MSLTHRLLVVLGVLAAALVSATRAQERLPVKIGPRDKSDVKRSEDKTDPKTKIEDLSTEQDRLRRQFDEFKQKLLRLAQTMENSTKVEDREKAKILREAIKKASAEGVETRFSSLIEMLRGGKSAGNTEMLQDILNENRELRQILKEIMELLLKDDRDAELKREIERARRLLEELKTVIRKQELVLNKTILPNTPNKALEKSQHNVKEQTHDLVNPKSDRSKEAKQGEGKDSKSGKQGIGEGKNDSKDPKGDAKDGKGDKSGEGKSGKQGEGKEGKGSKSGESKANKPNEGKESKPVEKKTGKPSDSKPGAGKSGDSKGKGEGKGESKGSSGQGKQGEAKSGQGGQSGQQGQQGEAKNGGNKGGQQQQQQQSDQAQSQIKKQIEDAEKYQDRAEDNLRKDNRKDAPEDEQAALDKLNQAKKALEDLLRQLREEEIERLLARLEARCRRMLALQIGVRDDTAALDKVIKDNPNGQATRADQQASNVLSDREEEIVKEARAGLALLEAEGSAVAFAEVFAQVKGDMETVALRLRKTDTGVVTVTIEDQIIDTLKEMIEALKKAQSDKKSQGGKSSSGMPQPDKLLDMLAELKMIRSMQKRVNNRTELYGKQYAGEQAPPPESGSTPEERERYDRIQGELKDLSKRQQKIGKVTHDLATGKNEQK
jgi:molecular chaperone GrpE (heat shock protein)